MDAKTLLRIVSKLKKCGKCGSTMLGEDQGEIVVGEKDVHRKCHCGYFITVNNEGIITDSSDYKVGIKNPIRIDGEKIIDRNPVRDERIKNDIADILNCLQDIRRKKGIAQLGVAMASGVSQQSISDLEVTKERVPSLKILLGYLYSFGISKDDFIKFIEEKSFNN